jgi:hypothetical protein
LRERIQQWDAAFNTHCSVLGSRNGSQHMDEECERADAPKYITHE